MGILSCQKEPAESIKYERAQGEVEMSALTKSAQKHYYKELKGRIIESLNSKSTQLIVQKSVNRAQRTTPKARVYALWKKASTSESAGRSVVEVPLHSSIRTVSLIKIARDSLGYEPDQSMIQTIFDRLVLYKEKEDKTFSQQVVRYHPDKGYLEKTDTM